MSAIKLYEEANDLMLNDQFDQALELFSTAIEQDDKVEPSTMHKCFIGRAQAHLKLGKHQEALVDADKAMDINKDDSRAYLIKGNALLNMREFEKALDELEMGSAMAEKHDEKKKLGLFADLIKKCEKEVSSAAAASSAAEPPVTQEPTAEATEAPQVQVPALPPSPPQVKYEWYQTESTVIVCILAKELTKEHLKIDTQENMLTIESIDPEKTKINFHFNLSHSISPNDTVVKFLPTKVEIKLKKTEAMQWSALEMSAQQLAAKKATACKTTYPSSSKKPKNWDKMVAEVIAEEKNEPQDTEKFFKQIFSDGSDELRRAMNKSYVESGGTVLSTNWSEVGAKKVETYSSPDYSKDSKDLKKYEK